MAFTMSNKISTAAPQTCKIVIHGNEIVVDPSLDHPSLHLALTMVNEISTSSSKPRKIVIHSVVSDSSALVNDPSETWSQCCQFTVERGFLSRLPLLLVWIHPERRLSAYRLRYDTGLATIIRPTWHPEGIHGELPVEEAFVDVNVSLRRNGTRNDVAVSEFEPHQKILSSLGDEGTQDTTFVDLHCEKNGIDVAQPFVVAMQRTRVLFFTEHPGLPGCIGEHRIEECSDENSHLPRKCINIFREGDEPMEVKETAATAGKSDAAVRRVEEASGGKVSDKIEDFENVIENSPRTRRRKSYGQYVIDKKNSKSNKAAGCVDGPRKSSDMPELKKMGSSSGEKKGPYSAENKMPTQKTAPLKAMLDDLRPAQISTINEDASAKKTGVDKKAASKRNVSQDVEKPPVKQKPAVLSKQTGKKATYVQVSHPVAEDGKKGHVVGAKKSDDILGSKKIGSPTGEMQKTTSMGGNIPPQKTALPKSVSDEVVMSKRSGTNINADVKKAGMGKKAAPKGKTKVAKGGDKHHVTEKPAVPSKNPAEGKQEATSTENKMPPSKTGPPKPASDEVGPTKIATTNMKSDVKNPGMGENDASNRRTKAEQGVKKSPARKKPAVLLKQTENVATYIEVSTHNKKKTSQSEAALKESPDGRDGAPNSCIDKNAVPKKKRKAAQGDKKPPAKKKPALLSKQTRKMVRDSQSETAAKDSSDSDEKNMSEHASVEEAFDENEQKKQSDPTHEDPKIGRVQRNAKRMSCGICPDPKPQKKKSKQAQCRAKKLPPHPTGEKHADTPAKPAEGLPAGWTMRQIPRAVGKVVDTMFFSPKEDYRFRSKPDAMRFLQNLEETNGDEKAAIILFKQKQREKETALSTQRKLKKSLEEANGDEAAAILLFEQKERDGRAAWSVDNKPANNDKIDYDVENFESGKGAKPRNKRKIDTNATKKALKELDEDGGSKSSGVDGETLKKKSKCAREETAKKVDAGGEARRSTREPKGDDLGNTEICHPKKSKLPTKKQSKPKKAVDPNQPKRPPNAYILFSRDARTRIKKEFPDLPTTEMSSKMGKMWKSIGEDGRKPYKDKADEALKKFETDLKAYQKHNLAKKSKLT